MVDEPEQDPEVVRLFEAHANRPRAKNPDLAPEDGARIYNIATPDIAAGTTAENLTTKIEQQPTSIIHQPPVIKHKTIREHLDAGTKGFFIPAVYSETPADVIKLLGDGNAEPVESEADSDLEPFPGDVRVTVTGVAKVPGFDEEKIVNKDWLIFYAQKLGLTVLQWYAEAEEKPFPIRRSWTYKRSSIEGAKAVIKDAGVISRDQLAEILFKEKGLPWPDDVRNAALLKTNVTIHKLHSSGWLAKRYDGGTLMLLERGHELADRLPKTPGGLTDIDERTKDKSQITNIMAAHGWAVIEAVRVTPRELARLVYTTMWHVRMEYLGEYYSDQDMVITDAMLDAACIVIDEYGLTGTALARAVYGSMLFCRGVE